MGEMVSGKHTRESIVDAAQVASARNNGPLSRTDFERLTGISQWHIYKLFPDGGWREVLALAEVDKHPHDTETISDEDLLIEYHRVACVLGGIPTWTKFAREASCSGDVIRRRFGGKQGTLKRYRAWLEQHDPKSPLLAMIGIQSKHEIPPPPEAESLHQSKSGNTLQWSKKNRLVYGKPLNFRGLQHAPVNEQGVVYLFGMVSYEIGFLVTAVQSSYPDCEALRCIDRRQDQWQRVTIEFEYRSSHFRDHGHPIEGCDIIICWQHDWIDCPLEVVELRRIINDLDG